MARRLANAKRGGLSAVWLLSAACYAPQRQAPIPMPLRLVSSQPFTLDLDATPSSPATTCVVQRADLDVRSLVGDTIRFSAVRSIEPPPLSPVCGHRGPGLVVASRYPDLKAEKPSVSTGRTWLTILLAIPAAFGLFVVAAFLSWSGT